MSLPCRYLVVWLTWFIIHRFCICLSINFGFIITIPFASKTSKSPRWCRTASASKEFIPSFAIKKVNEIIPFTFHKAITKKLINSSCDKCIANPQIRNKSQQNINESGDSLYIDCKTFGST